MEQAIHIGMTVEFTGQLGKSFAQSGMAAMRKDTD